MMEAPFEKLEDLNFDVICFSHLRWNFVYQRPQHLMGRFARDRRVFVIEEPIFGDEQPHFEVLPQGNNLSVAVPKVPHGLDSGRLSSHMRVLLDDLIRTNNIDRHLSWYYTPMMFEWSNHLSPVAVVYDCMDQLSAFKNAPPELEERESELLAKADLVFTGGHSLYEAKKESHRAVHAFPSSIDAEHFARADSVTEDPHDMAGIPRPRIGFVGVIDERLDTILLGQIAEKMPEWQFVMIGPVVKIDEAELPRHVNIHYLGSKSYNELPEYIGTWDIAMMPFAINESTRYISPTKTPEYLAAGRPVVSTPIRDVVRPYGENGLVHIAATADEFVESIEKALSDDAGLRTDKVRAFLSNNSWDSTFFEMTCLIDAVIEERRTAAAASAKSVGFP